jgi:hypothetical protein
VAYVTKDDLLALKPKTATVEADELGEGKCLLVQELDALSVIEWMSKFVTKDEAEGIQTRHIEAMHYVLERALINEDGTRLVADGEMASLWLPISVRQRAFTKALELSQLMTVDDSKKNLAPIDTSRAA